MLMKMLGEERRAQRQRSLKSTALALAVFVVTRDHVKKEPPGWLGV